MTSFLSDLSYAARTFLKKPAFPVTAILTLALGIGAAAAIFSVVNAVLLRPLPYDRPDRLVHIAHDLKARNVEDFPWAPADFHDLRVTQTAFEAVAGLATGRQVFPVEGRAEVEQVRTGAATPNLFRLLGTRIALGNDFTDADGAPLPPQPQPAPGAQPGTPPAPPPPPKTILSYEFFQRRFGGNPAVVGTVARFGPQPFEIIGVLEPGFEILYPPGLNIEPTPDLWTPIRVDFAAGSRTNVFLRVIGRLKDGVDMSQAQRDVDTLAADLRNRFPIKQTAGFHLRLERMHDDLVKEVRPTIIALMGAVTFVLLIACANVANLLLIRAASRERELAVRSALGSTRGRIIRQLLAESTLLAFLSVALGLGLAWAGVRALLALGPENLPRLTGVRVDPFVITFAALAGVLSILVFGLLPAIRASRPDINDLLRRAGRTSSLSAGGWMRNAVVAVAVAMSFVLLVGSGLMIRSFIALQRAQPGYDPNNVLTFSVPNLRLPSPEARMAFMRTLKSRLEALPGVLGATAAGPLPLTPGEGLARWGREDALSDPTKFRQGATHAVIPGYFETMRTRLIDGRTFTDADNASGRTLVVVDRLFAQLAYPGESAVGKPILIRIRTNEPERFEIIGVVDHQRHRQLAADGREAFFIADGLFGHGAAQRWAVRTSGDPMAIADQVRALVHELNPRTGAIEMQPMLSFVAKAQAQTKFVLVLIGIFATVALILAAVGLYSVLSTTVRQRTAEIGVRMAFGAAHASIFRMMVVQGLRLSAIGILAGFGAALTLTGAMRSMLVGVEPTDPATFAAMAAGFLVIAIVACGLPAWRASRLDPMAALRDE